MAVSFCSKYDELIALKTKFYECAKKSKRRIEEEKDHLRSVGKRFFKSIGNEDSSSDEGEFSSESDDENTTWSILLREREIRKIAKKAVSDMDADLLKFVPFKSYLMDKMEGACGYTNHNQHSESVALRLLALRDHLNSKVDTLEEEWDQKFERFFIVDKDNEEIFSSSSDEEEEFTVKSRTIKLTRLPTSKINVVEEVRSNPLSIDTVEEPNEVDDTDDSYAYGAESDSNEQQNADYAELRAQLKEFIRDSRDEYESGETSPQYRWIGPLEFAPIANSSMADTPVPF